MTVEGTIAPTMRLRGSILLAGCLFSGQAAASPGPQGSKITISRYNVDMFDGPVLSSSRVTALAGAYVPLADGVEGLVVNPAAPAVRAPYSYSHFDYDVSLGFTFPSALAATDFDNNGTTGFTYQKFVFFTVGGLVQIGQWGFGANVDARDYDSEQEAAPGKPLSVRLLRAHASLARNFFDAQLVVGVGFRFAGLDLTTLEGSATTSLLSMLGVAGEIGAVLAPHAWPFRLRRHRSEPRLGWGSTRTPRPSPTRTATSSSPGSSCPSASAFPGRSSSVAHGSFRGARSTRRGSTRARSPTPR